MDESRGWLRRNAVILLPLAVVVLFLISMAFWGKWKIEHLRHGKASWAGLSFSLTDISGERHRGLLYRYHVVAISHADGNDNMEFSYSMLFPILPGSGNAYFLEDEKQP